MNTRVLPVVFAAAWLVQGVLWAQEGDTPVQVTIEESTSSEDVLERVFRFECTAVQATPTLRIAFGKFREFSMSAGQLLTATEEGLATGVVTVRATRTGDAALTLSVEIGPDDPLTTSKVMPLPEGQSLSDTVQLTDGDLSSPFRRSIRLGQVSGAAISAYVMPGRVPVKQAAQTALQPPKPDGPPVQMFESWAKGIKSSDLNLFAKGYPSAQWNRWSEEQRQERLSQYQQAFSTVLGENYEPSELEAEYKGGVTRGTLTVTYGDKALPPLKVRRHGSRWILDEE